VKDRLDSMFDHEYFGTPLTILAVLLAALVAIRVTRFVVRRVIRRLAQRSLLLPIGHAGLWRRNRRDGENSADSEFRRRQRVDAASRMVSHIASVVIWLIATIVTFNLLDINATFYLSSAGFIGAAIAIGGQHKVSDYLTGLSVHFEDRYGVGDRLEFEFQATHIVAVVDHIGLFSTRLRDSRSTLHVPNAALSAVRNLSQEAAVSTIRLALPDDATADDAKQMLRGLAGTDGLTDVIFVGDLESRNPVTGEVEVEVRTARTLDERSRSRLVRRAEALLEDQR
jgi:small conductance mechanosensitive channel